MRISDWSSDVCSSDLPSRAAPRRWSRHREPRCQPRAAGPSSATAAAHSQSSAQSTPPPPTATDIRRDAPAPSEPHARGPRGKTCSSCSWLLSLKSWSLHKSRGGSVDLITEAVQVLENHPLIGRSAEQGPRELVISRGKPGYVALYSFEPEQDTVLVLSVRHQREAGHVPQ